MGLVWGLLLEGSEHVCLVVLILFFVLGTHRSDKTPRPTVERRTILRQGVFGRCGVLTVHAIERGLLYCTLLHGTLTLYEYVDRRTIHVGTVLYHVSVSWTLERHMPGTHSKLEQLVGGPPISARHVS